MERRSFIPEEQLELLLNAPMDIQEKLQELNEWERWQRERTPNRDGTALHPWFLCGSCGRPTQGDSYAPDYCSVECDPRVRKGKTTELSCGHCGRSFEVPARTSKLTGQRWRYCSAECLRLAKGTILERRCGVCGERILVRRTTVDDGTPYHCSARCRSIAGGTLGSTRCAHCGEEFDIPTRVLADGKPHYCSQSCSTRALLPDFATSSARSAFAFSRNGVCVSSIEAPVAAALERLGIDYEPQWFFTHPEGFYSCVADFHLPELNAVVEVNGTYWHADPHRYQDDELNETQLRGRERYTRKVELLALLGIELIEVWERDIHRADEVLLQGLLELRERRSASS